MSISGWALEMVRLKMVRLYPALIKWEHMKRPMTPVPIHPTRVLDGETDSTVAEVAMERRREVNSELERY